MDSQTSAIADSKTERPGKRTNSAQAQDEVVMDCKIDELYYGTFRAVRDTHIPSKRNSITAFIGPSGCGKSTILRCLNRMNDLGRGFRFKGHVKYRGKDIYEHGIDPVAVRRYIGMVFQQPNPFATSIFNNVALGLRINKFKGSKVEKVEQALKRAALWDEVKDKLNNSGLSLSGGQQQRLCIARAVATDPEVLLMDEPCSALDPIATRRIEELMVELKKPTPSLLSLTICSRRSASPMEPASFMSTPVEVGEPVIWWNMATRNKFLKIQKKSIRRNTFAESLANTNFARSSCPNLPLVSFLSCDAGNDSKIERLK